MIENNFLKRVTKSVSLGRKSRLYDRNIMHPERDWLFGVLVSMIILIFGGWWSIFTYEDLREPVEESVNTTAVESTYKEGLVKDALSKHKNRNAEYNQLKQELEKSKPATVEPEVIPEVVTEVVDPVELDESLSAEASTSTPVQQSEAVDQQSI